MRIRLRINFPRQSAAEQGCERGWVSASAGTRKTEAKFSEETVRVFSQGGLNGIIMSLHDVRIFTNRFFN